MIRLFAPVLLGAGLGAIAPPAHADDSCRYADGSVVCTDAGFAKLIDAALDFKTQSQESELKLAARERALDDARLALNTCIANPHKPSVIRAAFAYAAGVLGTALAAVAPSARNPTTQSALLWTGLVFIGGGAAFVIP